MKTEVTADAQYYATAYQKAKLYAEARAIANARDQENAWVEAEAKAKAYADADAKIKSAAEVLTPLHDHATDCLRLSMHFFHPIQQCAQQVYHTAVPLSPTSSWLHRSCLPSVMENQLSYVTAFAGAPSTWGTLLTTINTRPRQLTCVVASVGGIIAACEDLVNVYDAVTFVLQQSLHPPEAVTKIEGSPDGSVLFFAHSSSVTMWDIQTGGHINTFTTQSKINDLAISTTGKHIACGSSDGSVMVWDPYTKEKDKVFWNSQPIVAICGVSSHEFVVATKSSLCIHDILDDKTSSKTIPGKVWGMVYLGYKKEFLVGTSAVGQEKCFFVNIEYRRLCSSYPTAQRESYRQSPMHSGQLSKPTLVGEDVLCITGKGSGVQLLLQMD